MGQLTSLRGRLISIFFLLFFVHCLVAQQDHQSIIRGTVKDSEGNPVEFATIYIEEIREGTQSDHEGAFFLRVTPGQYTLRVQFMGYETYEQDIRVQPGEQVTVPVELVETSYRLDEVVIESKSGVQRVNETAYNVVALDARVQHNSTANLSGLLNKVSGVRIRETGGVGSEMQVMMDGFNGKHVKVFIDGVPQEGVGRSFGLNNIPVNYAERIEVYKGVVPVEFGTDAIGGVINIVTKTGFNKKWHLDASYSFGSFNTHKSHVNFGHAFDSGFIYEVNAFQNYSDNNYYIDTPVKEFLPDGGSSTDRTNLERVQRFHDTYHNEAVSGKIGLVNKVWTDRLILGFTYARIYMDIQNGVRQEVVFGGKYRKGYSLMPSLEYRKQDLLVEGLDITFTANYNKNNTRNVDTSAYEFNWRGEKRLRPGMHGEQSYMHLQSDNNNWNGTFTARYRLNDIHSFTFNNILNSFHRSNRSLLTSESAVDPIAKETLKNVSGISYLLRPNERWNASLFGKYYYQHVAGPVPTSSTLNEYVRSTKTTNAPGYGAAGTYFLKKNLQVKLSFEKVYRLPSNEEMFGDEDMEAGDIQIKPENSNNINLNVSYGETFGQHGVYVEGGVVYRDIKDYIQRNITGLSGGRYGATFINHGQVLTKGYTVTARYNFTNRLSVGGNFTEINTRDNVETFVSGSPNLAYKARMPNVPYLFANSDVTFYQHDLFKRRNVLTITYDNFFVKSFPLYSEAFGSDGKLVVPTQFSHNINISYSLKEGRYSVSFECQNLTDEKLYDNFSLQKAGRAFYGKVRISL